MTNSDDVEETLGEVEVKTGSILEQEDLTDDEEEYQRCNNSAANTPQRNNRSRTLSNFTNATGTSNVSTVSKRKRQIAKMGQRAASLKFSALDFVALSPDKLKKHYKIGKLIHRGRHACSGSLRSISSSIGSTSYYQHLHANIHVCVHKETGIQRAVKIYTKLRRWNPRQGQRMAQEFKILQNLDHPNLLKMYEMFEGTDHYYIVMDLCKGGDLCQELDAWGSLEEHDAALLIKQVLLCLSYLHTNQIVHGNVKPEHILLEQNKDLDQIKLTDFSCAEILEPDTTQDVDSESLTDDNTDLDNNCVPHTTHDDNDDNEDDDEEGMEQDIIYKNCKPKITPERKGTPDYWAPEVVLKGSTGPKRDVWAVGVLAHLVISNRFPFAGSSQEDICERIIRGEFSLDDNDSQALDDGYYGEDHLSYEDPAEFLENGHSAVREPFQWNRVTDEAKDFIRYLLTWEEDARPSARQALKHPWIIKHSKAGYTEEGSTRFAHQGDEFVNSLATMAAWNNVAKFNAPNKLKQATCTFIAAQLVLKHEREAIDHVFRALDIYSDGRLSKKEVRIGYKECFGRELSDEELDDLFKRVDLNGSGYIEYSEFLVAAMNEKDLLHSQKIQQAFSVFDRDGNGRISKEDLGEVLNRFKGVNKRESLTQRAVFEPTTEDIDDEIIDRIIREVDLAGDGFISYDEFMAMMLRTTDEIKSATEEEIKQDNGQPGEGHRKATMSIDSACTPEGLNVLKFKTGDFVDQRPGELTAFYDIEDFIDEGGFGKVYVCRHKATGAERAVKVINKSRWHRDENKKVLDEFNLLKQLDHPNILKMYDLFKDRHHYYIVMDICKGGDLCDELDTWGRLTEIDTAILMKQALSCLNYISSQKIIHRDLKPENILLEQNKEMRHIKIIDFGLATRYVDGVEMTRRVGTAEYMAPEVVNRSYFGCKCDIWSCGVICFLCLSDRFPFYASNQEELYKTIVAGKLTFPTDKSRVWDNTSAEAKDFVTKLLTVDPSKRPTAEKALLHPWLGRSRIGRVNNVNLEHTDNAERLGEQAAASSAMSALANIQSFCSIDKLRNATRTFIASQLLLKEEKQALDEVFRDLDITCNGRLSKAEVRAAYFKYFGHSLNNEDVDDLFSHVDANKSGFIDYSEFVVAAMNEKVLLSDKKLRKAFDLFDKDGNGLICASDLNDALSFFCGGEKDIDDKTVQNLIMQMDSDGDGFVSYDEFVAMMLLSTDEDMVSV